MMGGRKASRSRDMLLALEVYKLTIRDDALKVEVSTLKEHIKELKVELVIYKVDLGNGVLARKPNQWLMSLS
ncbi:hypothetical protein PVK06_035755 [Gossypium arboreum]|uniref:Uncharacterized protein n=1 Tax=Gossypium arboreum TaxID=29729 RepID=A0ABR0NJS9_GOSAR|nr:hypothetical protein PVK06_035755 [Gossypium arboreum]